MKIKNYRRQENDVIIIKEDFWGDTQIIKKKRKRPYLEIELEDQDIKNLIPIIGFGLLGCAIGILYNCVKKKKGRRK